MAIKKSDLYGMLWKSCDELRGGMDASQYKDYVLTLLFLKYVSDKAKTDDGSLIEVPEGCSFEDLVALKGNDEIGEKIDVIIAKLANANELQGVINVTSFNDDAKLGKGKEMVDRISKLIAIFEGLDFRASRADGDDLLGDAYEYLMQHFAAESGKSKGQFYTPAEVSRILAKVVGIDDEAEITQTIYDPTCGSGSLLLKAANEAPRGLTIYGQEKDLATWSLARMNMVLHGNETAEIDHGDVISSPGFTQDGRLKQHDFVVANPPFSVKAWNNGILAEEDQYKRFEVGVPPDKNGDYAFLLHAIKSLKSTGKAAVILPHGVLFRGGAEEVIRRKLIELGLIKGVIGLPANLFYGTGIPACIVVIDKEGADRRDSIFLINASEGFKKDGPKNRLREQDIHKIVDVFETETEIEGFSRKVSRDEIASEANDFNLNLPRYIDASEPEDLQDLDAHLNGGIPDHDLNLLADYWEAFPSLREQLFEAERPGYSKAKVSSSEVQETIDSNSDVQAFSTAVEEKVSEWWQAHQETLEGIDKGTLPGPIIEELSEDLLDRFEDFSLLDPYDIYEQLMTYWAETMQDDLYLVSAEGWFEAAQPRAPREIGKSDKGKPKYEEADLSFGSGKTARKYKMDLLPHEVIVERFFAEGGTNLEELELKRDQSEDALADYVQEYGVDDEAPLGGIVSEKGTVTKSDLKSRIEELRLFLFDATLKSHFPDEHEDLLSKRADLERASEERSSFISEHADDGRALSTLVNGKGKVTQKALKEEAKKLDGLPGRESDLQTVTRCLELMVRESKAKRELKKNKASLDKKFFDSGIDPSSAAPDVADDLNACECCLELLVSRDEANTAVQDAEISLGEKTVAKYAELDDPEIRACVIAGKWLPAIEREAEGIAESQLASFVKRVVELQERYLRTLGALLQTSDERTQKVSQCLTEMGVHA